MTDLTRREVDAKLATGEVKNAASEARVDARLANFDTSVKTGFAELRADLAKMQREMHKNTVDLIKLGISVGLACVAVTISVLTFVVKTSADKPPAQPLSAPATSAAPGSSPPVAPQTPRAYLVLPATQSK